MGKITRFADNVIIYGAVKKIGEFNKIYLRIKILI